MADESSDPKLKETKGSVTTATVADLWVAITNAERSLAQSRRFLGTILAGQKITNNEPLPGIDRATLDLLTNRNQWGPVKCPTWPFCFIKPRMIVAHIAELGMGLPALVAAVAAIAERLGKDNDFPVYKDDSREWA